MLRRVPPPLTQVDASAEGQLVIDDRHLLMLRRADWMLAVQTEMHSLVGFPAEPVLREQLSLHGVDHREVPARYVDVQVGAIGSHGVEQRSERHRHINVAVAKEPKLAVYVPTHEKHRPLRAANRLVKRAEVRLSVDEKRDAFGASDCPAVLSFLKQTMHLVVRVRAFLLPASCIRSSHLGGKPDETHFLCDLCCGALSGLRGGQPGLERWIRRRGGNRW